MPREKVRGGGANKDSGSGGGSGQHQREAYLPKANQDGDAFEGGDDDFEAERYRRMQKRKQDKAFMRNKQADLDELVPKPDPGSFQARREKNLMRHGGGGGGRDDDGFEMDESVLMGSGGADEQSFRRRLAREREMRERKQEEMDRRVAEYQRKEQEKVQQILAQSKLANKFSSSGTL
eukprot:GEZU01002335.1.p2 GENE.GEZU01002335.1~~GEZU01002335.1.p2  ORF type:complete len:178 (+),score=64.79 GEZU01002335.1:936-1469(+)